METSSLKELLLQLYEEESDKLEKNYSRNLSFQDTLFDRFERAKKLGFDEGASIYNSALTYGKVEVGKKTWIGPNVILDGSGGGVRIGSYCSISAGVHIYTHDTVMWALSGGQADAVHASVEIGDCTYIGAQAVIKAGVKIGSQCVIGANSFINRDIPQKSVVVGSPGKVIGCVIDEGGAVVIKYKGAT